MTARARPRRNGGASVVRPLLRRGRASPDELPGTRLGGGAVHPGRLRLLQPPGRPDQHRPRRRPAGGGRSLRRLRADHALDRLHGRRDSLRRARRRRDQRRARLTTQPLRDRLPDGMLLARRWIGRYGTRPWALALGISTMILRRRFAGGRRRPRPAGRQLPRHPRQLRLDSGRGRLREVGRLDPGRPRRLPRARRPRPAVSVAGRARRGCHDHDDRASMCAAWTETASSSTGPSPAPRGAAARRPTGLRTADEGGRPAGATGSRCSRRAGVSVENLTACNFLGEGSSATRSGGTAETARGTSGLGAVHGALPQRRPRPSTRTDKPHASYGIFVEQQPRPGTPGAHLRVSNMNDAELLHRRLPATATRCSPTPTSSTTPSATRGPTPAAS